MAMPAYIHGEQTNGEQTTTPAVRYVTGKVVKAGTGQSQLSRVAAVIATSPRTQNSRFFTTAKVIGERAKPDWCCHGQVVVTRLPGNNAARQ